MTPTWPRPLGHPLTALAQLSPDDWHPVGTAPFDQPHSLLLGSTEVLGLNQCVGDSTWLVSLSNQRDDWNLWKHRLSSSCE